MSVADAAGAVVDHGETPGPGGGVGGFDLEAGGCQRRPCGQNGVRSTIFTPINLGVLENSL